MVGGPEGWGLLTRPTQTNPSGVGRSLKETVFTV